MAKRKVVSRYIKIAENCLYSDAVLSTFNFHCLLKLVETIQEVENDGAKLLELEEEFLNELEQSNLDRILLAATHNNNHSCIGRLFVKGAQNLEKCLEVARSHIKPQAYAILLLIKASLEGDSQMVEKLFMKSENTSEESSPYRNAFTSAQHAILNGTISTVVPIEIALRNGHTGVLRSLLLQTNMRKDEQSVQWSGLNLQHLDYFMLWKMIWVKLLELAGNQLTVLPESMADYIKQVRTVDAFLFALLINGETSLFCL